LIAFEVASSIVAGLGVYSALDLLLAIPFLLHGSAVNAQVLDRVAEPLRIRGRLVRRDGRSFLYANPDGYERVQLDSRPSGHASWCTPRPARCPVGLPA
jgi:hypothetical protein